ncbi:hypothetical protein, partial [Klebsiella pneumoniae]|uniref:hypothetical protein n=1 Tax=Klebsiella pneumoniae TaxID=573 RepID=UPI001E60AF59
VVAATPPASASAPTEGYSASTSLGATKTDQPLITTAQSVSVVKLIAVDLLAALIAISRIAFVGAGGELTAIVRVAGAVQRQR